MTDERLAELKEKYKDRNLLVELVWGAYANHMGYTSKQNGEFLNWLCMMAYKALKERPEDQWTPVSEGLPEEDNDYLITYEAYGGEKIVSKSWFNTRFGFIYENVIAWKPLPEPYKKGGAE